jgi:hypothetical protein
MPTEWRSPTNASSGTSESHSKKRGLERVRPVSGAGEVVLEPDPGEEQRQRHPHQELDVPNQIRGNATPATPVPLAGND